LPAWPTIAAPVAPSSSPTAASICCIEGDRLIVAINDDESVRKLKGPARPILPVEARAELVAALRVADYVVVFSEPTVERLLLLVKPDVHCKGTDYTVESVPERDVVKSYGGRTAIVGDAKAHSTRELLARVAGREKTRDLLARVAGGEKTGE
jgi:rfaE bifunctional protein nucleotidyltransferase chain/domain